MRKTIRRSIGMARVVAHLTRGAATMAFAFPFMDNRRRRASIKHWSDGVLEIFGLTLVVEGRPICHGAAASAMLVGNHISWVDIYAYLSVTEVRFVAKSEVRSWPLIGWFATNLGTIFVERDRPRDAIRVGRELGAALQAGEAVCVFPEGTTTDGSIVLPFSSVLLSAAIAKAVPIQPVAIAYERLDGTQCRRTAFIGDTTLVASLWELAGGDRSLVRLTFLDPIDTTTAAERRSVARLAENAVRGHLGHRLRSATHPPKDPAADGIGPQRGHTVQPMGPT